jgi:hypothetical protein
MSIVTVEDMEAEARVKARQRFIDAESERLKAYAVWEHRATPVFEEMHATEGFWYVMTPYSKYPRGMPAAYNDAVRVAASFTVTGLRAFSTIVHSHPQALVARLPGDARFWWDHNLVFMKASCGAVVVEMEGWKESEGIALEIDWYAQQGKRVLNLPCPPLSA